MNDEKKTVTPQSEAIAGSGKENDQTPQPMQANTTDKPKRHPDPTRYGDWELNGKCVDF